MQGAKLLGVGINQILLLVDGFLCAWQVGRLMVDGAITASAEVPSPNAVNNSNQALNCESIT